MIIPKIYRVVIFSFLPYLHNYGQTAQYIKFNKENIKATDCNNTFVINSEFVKNKDEREILQRLLFKSFIDDKECGTIPKEIFSKKSYKNLVLTIFDDTTFYRNSIYDYQSRWREQYSNMVAYCTNNKMLIGISNDLLKRNIDDGVIALFGNKKYQLVKRMKSIKKYIRNNQNDFYRISLLSVIYHNAGDFVTRDQILKNFDATQKSIMSSLFTRKQHIEYVEYLEEVNGGV